MSTPSFISTRLDEIAVRTERGAEIIRREPREIPRRLRGLLLAIDGRQTVRTYIAKLEGFGDVENLLSELATLGLLEFRSKRRSPKAAFERDGDSVFGESTFGGFAQAEAVMGDRAQLFQTVTETTMPGPFSDLVRMAQLEDRTYAPPSPPPGAPIGNKQAHQQVESLFTLLEAVRNDRKTLKTRVERLYKYRAQAESLTQQNRRLLIGIYALSGICVVLLGVIVFTGVCR